MSGQGFVADVVGFGRTMLLMCLFMILIDCKYLIVSALLLPARGTGVMLECLMVIRKIPKSLSSGIIMVNLFDLNLNMSKSNLDDRKNH